MKKIMFVLGLFLISTLTFSQSKETWYKIFTGKIGNLPATFHLHKSGKDYSGYIWFTQTQIPMQIYGGYPVAKTDSIMISASSGPISLILTGLFKENNFNGFSRLEKDGNPGKQSGFELQVSTEKNWTSFTYLFTEGNATLPPQLKNESRGTYLSSAIWPSGNKPLDEALKKYIRQKLGMKTATTETGKWINDEKNKAIASWKSENIKMYPKGAADMGMSLSFHVENKILLMHENDKLISVSHYSFHESGGAAHGNYNTAVITFSKKNNKPLILSDVVNAEGIKQLPAILEQVARIQFGIKNNKPLDENGFLVKKIPAIKNFFITGACMGFVFAPYEIKPFSDGEVTLTIPLTALKNYLLPGFQ